LMVMNCFGLLSTLPEFSELNQAIVKI
jgi:hypothetical protein